LPISANVETQQDNHTPQPDQQPDQAQAADTFTGVKGEREQRDQQWISRDEQAGER
jgi:hypothetical protein